MRRDYGQLGANTCALVETSQSAHMAHAYTLPTSSTERESKGRATKEALAMANGGSAQPTFISRTDEGFCQVVSLTANREAEWRIILLAKS